MKTTFITDHTEFNKVRAYFERCGEVRYLDASPKEIVRIIGGRKPNMIPQYHIIETIDKPTFILTTFESDRREPTQHYHILHKADGWQHTFANPDDIGKHVANAWDKWRELDCQDAIVGVS